MRDLKRAMGLQESERMPIKPSTVYYNVYVGTGDLDDWLAEVERRLDISPDDAIEVADLLARAWSAENSGLPYPGSETAHEQFLRFLEDADEIWAASKHA